MYGSKYSLASIILSRSPIQGRPRSMGFRHHEDVMIRLRPRVYLFEAILGVWISDIVMLIRACSKAIRFG
jgi:hypothetical protein